MFRILAQCVTDVNILDVITKVDSLYNNAYIRLWMFIAAVFALVGIFIPFLIQSIQRRSFIAEKDEILKQAKNEIKQSERKFEKALAAKSAMHFMELAKNQPYNDGYNLDNLCLFLLVAKEFAEAEDINGIYRSLESIEAMQLPKVSFGKNIEREHAKLLSQYDMAYTAIKECGFEKQFTTQFNSIKTKIEDWHRHLKDKQG